VVGGVPALQQGQPGHQGPAAFVLHEHQSDQQLVPGPDRVHHRQDEHRRAGQRQHDPPQGRHRPGPVDRTGLGQLRRDGAEEVAPEERDQPADVGLADHGLLEVGDRVQVLLAEVGGEPGTEVAILVATADRGDAGLAQRGARGQQVGEAGRRRAHPGSALLYASGMPIS
jgi:hypothetical protein